MCASGSDLPLTTMTDEHRLADADPATQPDDAPRDANDDAVLDEEGDAVNTQKNINESHDKIRLSVDVTRGEGTRDQEKHKLKARGESPEEAAENLSRALAELEERDVFTRARDLGNDDE